jgi:hypothetical protein
VVTVDDLVDFMSSADPADARRALHRAADALCVEPPFRPDIALSLLEAITAEGGALGVIACFAKARAILEFTNKNKRRP